MHLLVHGEGDYSPVAIEMGAFRRHGPLRLARSDSLASMRRSPLLHPSAGDFRRSFRGKPMEEQTDGFGPCSLRFPVSRRRVWNAASLRPPCRQGVCAADPIENSTGEPVAPSRVPQPLSNCQIPGFSLVIRRIKTLVPVGNELKRRMRTLRRASAIRVKSATSRV